MFYIASKINTKSLKISVVIKINTISLFRENKINPLDCKNPPYKSTKNQQKKKISKGFNS